ncbi:MAG: hypothetical protein HUJ13_08780 [Hydrogenovibrio crunogenus]|uniref:Uncharacterized protein n=1 Tax=Hydrogenovibrio crunogenus (strain DSM 25203 / XCL-2) TaxID=317025 RepID=Q31IU6_HYDCU|nr:hypothetical protein [Hydrogenovibrio crunogenus]
MAKHLSKRDIEAVVNHILGWGEEKLTWNTVLDAIEPLIGYKPTRQTLYANQDIRDAFKSKKSGIRQKGIDKPKPSNLNVAADRIAHLRAENEMLKKKNAALLEQFVKWQYNAYKYGLTEVKLNEPLPSIDRERSDD